MTGKWCCDETAVVQTADGAVLSRAAYGNGNGTLSGLNLTITFDPGSTLWAAVSADCNTCSWDSGAVWRRQAQRPPPPAWAAQLSILELNALTYTSDAGDAGEPFGPDGSGSGTWAALTERVPYLADLGVNGIWLAYYNLADSFWHSIRTVYAALDPPTLDPRMGPPEDFRAFMAACEQSGIHVFLDAIGMGLVPNSSYIDLFPAWFSPLTPAPPYGLVNYDYTSPSFLAWWTGVWTSWALESGADGMRIDSASLGDWWPAWDAIVKSTAAQGKEIAVWGEGRRYHFDEHDFYAPQPNISATLATMLSWEDGCLATICFSDHDNGGAPDQPPANYFFLRGSRAQFGHHALSPFIPLWLGGEEYDEDPVVFLPAERSFGQNQSEPGGWMYASVRQWGQLSNVSKAAMRDDVRAVLAAQRAHADVLHHNACAALLAELPLFGASPPGGLVPYVRWLDGRKAVLVLANAGTSASTVSVRVPLAEMGLAGKYFEQSRVTPQTQQLFNLEAVDCDPHALFPTPHRPRRVPPRDADRRRRAAERNRRRVRARGAQHFCARGPNSGRRASGASCGANQRGALLALDGAHYSLHRCACMKPLPLYVALASSPPPTGTCPTAQRR